MKIQVIFLSAAFLGAPLSIASQPTLSQPSAGQPSKGIPVETVRSTDERILKLESKQEAYGDLLSTTQNYLQYSGWIGVLITVVLVIFTIWNIITLQHRADELETKVENKIAEFQELAGDRKALLKTMEQANFEQIRIELEDSSLFSDALYRATFLTLESKRRLTPRIRSCVFDPSFSRFFFETYTFVAAYSENPTGDFSLQVLNYIPKDINAPWGFVNSIVINACEKSGRTASEIFDSIRDIELRRSFTPTLADFCRPEDAWDFYKKVTLSTGSQDPFFFTHLLDSWKPEIEAKLNHLQNLTSIENIQDRNAYLSRVLKSLSLQEKGSLIQRHYLEGFSLEIDPILRAISSEELTDIIAPFYSSLPPGMSYLDGLLAFDERIIREKSKSPTAIKDDHYLLRFIDNPIALAKIVQCFDLNNPDVWISCLQIYNFDNVKGPQIQHALEGVFSGLSPRPDSDFFNSILPECLKLNYGLYEKDGAIWFGNQLLPQQATNQFDYHTKSWKKAVIHPILQFNYFTDRISAAS